jgi:hypothetical protein
MPDFVDLLSRVAMGAVGVAMALHYSATAGYLGRAPRAVVAPLLGLLVADGLFIVLCAIGGQLMLGVWAMAAATPVLVAFYLVAFVAGMSVSDVFEQQAQDRDHERMRFYVGQAVHGYEYVANDIVTDSGLAELKAAQRREKERA